MNSFVELVLIKSNYASYVVVVSFFSSKRISPEGGKEEEEKSKFRKFHTANIITIRSFFKTRWKIPGYRRIGYEVEFEGDRREGRFSFQRPLVASWMWVSLVFDFKRTRAIMHAVCR